MSCGSAQQITKAMHEKDKATLMRYQAHIEEAYSHLLTCDACKAWFNKDMCDYVGNLDAKEALDEDTYAMHGMMHDAIQSACTKLRYDAP